mmetsp:Transcript_34586/g.95273  ORF Transcript_34586/g.95273 Transcript_34586/m.95273 type:complete len:374 (+) Transcript_34586:3535-4656(+)
MLRLDFDAAFVFRLHHLQDRVHHLITHVRNMGASLDRTDGIHKADLVETAIADAHGHLPAVAALLVNNRRTAALFAVVGTDVKLDVVHEARKRKLFAIQHNFYLFARGACHVIDTLHHEAYDVVIHFFHAELFKVWPKGDTRKICAAMLRDLGLSFRGHVVLVDLLEFLFRVFVCRLDDELSGEDVREFRTVAIAATGHLLLVIIVVVTREKLPENELWHVAFVLLVDHHWDSLAIVQHRNATVLLVDRDIDEVHSLWVTHAIVRCVDEDFVEDLVQRRHVIDLPVHDFLLALIIHEHLLKLVLCGAHVRVRTKQDVLELRLLLVNLLDGLPPAQLRCWRGSLIGTSHGSNRRGGCGGEDPIANAATLRARST